MPGKPLFRDERGNWSLRLPRRIRLRKNLTSAKSWKWRPTDHADQRSRSYPAPKTRSPRKRQHSAMSRSASECGFPFDLTNACSVPHAMCPCAAFNLRERVIVRFHLMPQLLKMQDTKTRNARLRAPLSAGDCSSSRSAEHHPWTVPSMVIFERCVRRLV